MSVKLKGTLLVSWITDKLNITHYWVLGSTLGIQTVLKVSEAGCVDAALFT
jgi:hypothetical protein